MEDKVKTAETKDTEENSVSGSHADAEESQGKENANDIEFDDGGKDAAAEEEEKARIKAQNSENARRRREAERQREIAKARESAIIEALDGKNPYTDKEMKDASDVEEFLIMKEIDKNGGDPLTDFAEFSKKRQREKAESEAKENERKEWYKSDRDRFVAKHPDIDLPTLIADEKFRLFAQGKVGNMPLTEIYDGFMKMQGDSEDNRKAFKIASQMLANKKASPGSASSPSRANDFFSREQVKAMTQEEVHKNYEKIRKSMAKW